MDNSENIIMIIVERFFKFLLANFFINDGDNIID
jgi:hypothetical protein